MRMTLRQTAPRRAPRRALTLVEVLVAITITVIIVTTVSLAFLSVIRSSDDAEALVRGHTAARAAVETIARELRSLQLDGDPDYQQLLLVDQPLAYGDNIDNDEDGAIDEELFDGRDDDGDWTLSDDRHVQIGSFTERATFTGVPDYGDPGVDEDTRFSADQITFVVPAGITAPDAPRLRVTYRLGTFEGEDNVLLRLVEVDPPANLPQTPIVEPIVFDVVSLDILAWNPNNNVADTPLPGRPYWDVEWDARAIEFPAVRPADAPVATVPPFRLPAAFLIRVTVNAERFPLEEIPGWPLNGEPLRTVTLSTVVTVEQTIQDPVYDAFVRN